jgi:peptidoglycan/xylan/chitin deacetylase (PgdA/CDA1 family)
MTEASANRATVCLTFDFDAVSLWMAFGANGARALSRGEFGAKTGAPRILDVLDRYDIKTTWFTPGHTAETFPAVTRDVVERGHEIGNHGYLHEIFDSIPFEEVKSVIRKGNDAIERVTGVRPQGMRAPAGDFDGRLQEFLLDEGFAYDSSRWDGEFELYWARGLDTLHSDGPNELGAPIDLVEVPLSLMMQDLVYFEADFAVSAFQGRCAPSQVEEIWRDQFQYMYDRVPDGVLVVTMHPQSIGWGLRAAMLERFIEHCLSQPGTRFATCATVAAEFRAAAGSQPLESATTPAN